MSVLHALEVLGEERSCRVVLSPLISHGAAGRVTLACQQLRHLCQRAVKDLKFTSEDCIPASTQLHERFPNCKTVSLWLSEPKDFSLTYPPILASLARYEQFQGHACSKGLHAPFHS